MKQYVIGVDYGTDSVRAIIMDALNGKEVSSAVSYYKRWSEGLYCNPSKNQYRQHPLDYIEGLENSITEALASVSKEVKDSIAGISIDTTGSTPVPVDKKGMPLALLDGFEENPNAMFILWKDHTSIKEAAEINELAKKYHTDYTKYVGGVYSSEWFWAKILRTLRVDKQVRDAAYSWIEHCDWIPYLLTGQNEIDKMKRSRCAAGHKAMWHPEFDGLPEEAFLEQLDPLLTGLRSRLFKDTFTADVPAGNLSKEWADRLGLSKQVVIGVGAFDAHMGAVGAEIEPYYLSKVMGTSTCDILIAPLNEVSHIFVDGICGQVEGSVIPGMMGMEAGQSAFGDVYAWFKNLISWPLIDLLNNSDQLNHSIQKEVIDDLISQIIPNLSRSAEKLPVEKTDIIALDWFNGRRTPYANQNLKSVISGLDLGSDAPRIFKALVEATCFGARQIIDRFQEEGIKIEGIIALGGVSKKSPFVVQTLSDIINMPVKVTKAHHTTALGAAMFAATASGIYKNVEEAKNKMGSGFDKIYHPRSRNVPIYETLYSKFKDLSSFAEKELN